MHTSRRWWLVAILLVGAGLRLWGIAFGLPELYHQDEQVTVNVALRMGSGDLNPHYFFHPHLVHYLLFSVYGMTYLLGHLIGWFPNVQDYERLFVMNPALFYLLGRLLGAGFGIVTLYLVYRLGRTLWSPAVGLWASGALAVCFLHTRNSHYIRHDIPVTCLIVLCFWWWNTVHWRRLRDTVLAGVLLGLAVAANWNAVTLLPWLLMVLGARHTETVRSSSWWVKSMAAASAGVLFGVFLASPFVILAAREAFEGVLPVFRRAGILASSPVIAGERPNWLTHYPKFLWVGMGGAPLLLGIAGTIMTCWRGTRVQRHIAWFAPAYFLLIGQVPSPHPEYVIPILPFLCLMAAVAIVEGYERLFRPGVFRAAMAAGLTVAIFSWTTLESIRHDWLLTQVDTRTLAKQWIEARVPPGTRIGLEAYTVMSAWVPRLSEQPEQQQRILAQIQQADATAGRWRALQMQYETPRRSFELIEISGVARPDERYTNHYNFSELLRQGVEYAVVSSYWIESRGNPRLHPRESRFYQDLGAHAMLVAEFSPFDPQAEPSFDITGAHTPFLGLAKLIRPGPVIRIYQLPVHDVVHGGGQVPHA